MTLFAGTSGWAYPTWKPGFYPKSVAAKKFLHHYATRLNTVEVNFTFRSLCKQTQLEGWLAETGEDFRFSFKAPQTVTHLRRLRNCGDVWRQFVESLAPVRDAGRFGAVLLQFPPNFRAESPGKDKRVNRDALADFLARAVAPSALRTAVEFRDASWFTPQTFAILREHNVALCWAESDDLATPREPTAGFRYLRLRCSEYESGQIAALRAELAAQPGEAFVYFKHEEQPDGALRAEELLRSSQPASE